MSDEDGDVDFQNETKILFKSSHLPFAPSVGMRLILNSEEGIHDIDGVIWDAGSNLFLLESVETVEDEEEMSDVLDYYLEMGWELISEDDLKTNAPLSNLVKFKN